MKIEVTRTFDVLDHLVMNHPKDDILAGKNDGEWVKYSSHDYYKFAHFLAYGFMALGLQRGDRAVTISHNCPEWNFADMALAMTGLIHVPIYPTLAVENYVHIFEHSEAKIVLVSSNLLLRRIRPALQKLANPPEVYTMAHIDGEKRMLDILKLGIANREQFLPDLEHRKAEITPDDWTTLIYTSGTSAFLCRSEEHTSELQSPDHLVCRLLLEKK